MLKQDLLERSPAIKIIGNKNFYKNKFASVLSRAGVGKTQFLVQIALSWLMKGENILHISLNEQLEKINIRYKEAYFNLINDIGYVDLKKSNYLWELINPCKTGISYNNDESIHEKVMNYLKSLKKENLKIPAMMAIDGLNFDKDLTKLLDEFKNISQEFFISIWFSMQSHREEPLSSKGFPKQFENVKHKFDKALFLQPKKDMIEVIILKDGDRTNNKYILNPATMMITK